MSLKLMSQIWDNRDQHLTGSKLVIMLCLADHANDNGECWPSIARLAERARIAPANVTRHIKELEAAGYLTVTRTSGTHNTYVVATTPHANAAPPAGPARTHPARPRDAAPRANAIAPRAPEQPTPRANVAPPRAPTRAEPSVNRQEPAGEPAASTPSDASTAGNDVERQAKARLRALNAKLGPELRGSLAEVLLQITGTAGLANTNTVSGYAALYAAHDAAVTLYQMGYKSTAALLQAESGWYSDDFRGKQGERPTLKQFIEWAAKSQATPRSAFRTKGKDHANHPKPAPSIDTHDNETALRRLLGLGPNDPIPDDDE